MVRALYFSLFLISIAPLAIASCTEVIEITSSNALDTKAASDEFLPEEDTKDQCNQAPFLEGRLEENETRVDYTRAKILGLYESSRFNGERYEPLHLMTVEYPWLQLKDEIVEKKGWLMLAEMRFNKRRYLPLGQYPNSDDEVVMKSTKSWVW